MSTPTTAQASNCYSGPERRRRPRISLLDEFTPDVAAALVESVADCTQPETIQRTLRTDKPWARDEAWLLRIFLAYSLLILDLRLQTVARLVRAVFVEKAPARKKLRAATAQRMTGDELLTRVGLAVGNVTDGPRVADAIAGFLNNCACGGLHGPGAWMMYRENRR